MREGEAEGVQGKGVRLVVAYCRYCPWYMKHFQVLRWIWIEVINLTKKLLNIYRSTISYTVGARNMEI